MGWWLFRGIPSIVTLVILCGITAFIAYAILLTRFHRMMLAGDTKYPAPRGNGVVRFVLTPVTRFLQARRAAKVWFAEREHMVLAALAATIATWGSLQTVATADAMNFARSGSLIVVLGFFSIFIGSIHARALFEARRTIHEEKAVLERIANAERAQGLSSVWVFWITFAGTIIWGYGDVLWTWIRGQ